MTAVLAAEELRIVRAGREVVRSVSFELRTGELTALVGPNGSGKSTLLEALVGGLSPARGRVMLGGESLADLPRSHRARRLAWVGRELGRDLPLTVRGLVELGRLPYLKPLAGLSREDVAVVDRALSWTDCTELAGRPIHALSDGERQRAHVARALAQEPRILLLDEATAHLDLSHREDLLGRARRFTGEGGAALVVLHDLDLAVRYCERIAVLHEGELVTVGRPDVALSAQILDRVFGVDATIVHDASGPTLRTYGARGARRRERALS